ncbi:MAG: FliG C-terminal domain-containing protein [bacterium]
MKLLSFLLCFSLPAQLLLAQTVSEDKPLAEIEHSMEANLTWNLQNALLLYYPETKFVVKANVELQKSKPRVVLPRLPEALLSKRLTSLPGLPYIPENIGKQSAESDDPSVLRGYVQKNSYDVRRIRVNILVDRSLSDNDWAFIRRYASLIADLQPQRGDQVHLEALEFPQKDDFFKARKARLDSPKLPEPTPKEARFDWRPYVFAAGIAAVLLVILFLGTLAVIRQLKKNRSTVPSPSHDLPKDELETAGKSSLGSAKETDVTEEMRLQSSSIDAIVGTPSAAAKVFQQWIDRSAESGIEDAAMVLAAISKPLIDLIAPYLDTETGHKIREKMEELEETDVKENSARLLKQFDEDLRRLVLKMRQDDRDEDALAFLHRMSEDQLQHLLKPLKTGVKAIVLAQIQPHLAAELLSKMEADEKKAVLAAMGNIQRIPLDVYQHITRQLAARASKLGKMRYVRANGVDALLKVMDHLDEDTQEDTINYLHTQDVNLAQKVSKKFMTFHQLFGLPNERIHELALDVDREVLAKSLVTVDEQEVNKIIAALPDRLGELVRASLETHHDLSEDEIARARRTLMRSLRAKKSDRILR